MKDINFPTPENIFNFIKILLFWTFIIFLSTQPKKIKSLLSYLWFSIGLINLIYCIIFREIFTNYIIILLGITIGGIYYKYKKMESENNKND